MKERGRGGMTRYSRVQSDTSEQSARTSVTHSKLFLLVLVAIRSTTYYVPTDECERLVHHRSSSSVLGRFS